MHKFEKKFLESLEKDRAKKIREKKNKRFFEMNHAIPTLKDAPPINPL